MLAGVKTITLHDTKETTNLDLATQYYLKKEDLGRNRGLASEQKIKELNSYVMVEVSNVDLNTVEESFFSKFKCVVLTEAPLQLQLRVNEICHKHNIPFLSARVCGVFGWAFADFGEDFEVKDKSGESVREVHVGEISNAEKAMVKTVADEPHGLEEGMFIQFREVKGMLEINGDQKWQVLKTVNKSSFLIGDTSKFSKYESGGIATEVKVPFKKSYVHILYYYLFVTKT